MSALDVLENESIYILREAYAAFPNLCMLWSIGKDSTVLLRLAKKAFFGHIPFPLIHIDTGFKIPEMIEFRDKVVREQGLCLIYGRNERALREGRTFPGGKLSHIDCCRTLKTETLSNTLSGKWCRYKFNAAENRYEEDTSGINYTGVIAGIRADEEGSRSKERVFSPRGTRNNWEIDRQPPEFWDQYKTVYPHGTQVRIHPLLNWTELNIWEYIAREKIEVIPLYFNRGDGTRYRSLGCAPCTRPIRSDAATPQEIIAELSEGQLAHVAERSGREQDREDNGGLEKLRKEGYM